LYEFGAFVDYSGNYSARIGSFAELHAIFFISPPGAPSGRYPGTARQLLFLLPSDNLHHPEHPAQFDLLHFSKINYGFQYG
jgi:hypothetical protein